ncbi:TPA: DNA-binding response regulator, partial [Stenotrophomonas maltophilia]|nr:DNA-binding response regulator [Stenotrophomonas maltophilia]
MHAAPALAALVLIVEDEAEIADILTAYLEREGLRT